MLYANDSLECLCDDDVAKNDETRIATQDCDAKVRTHVHSCKVQYVLLPLLACDYFVMCAATAHIE